MAAWIHRIRPLLAKYPFSRGKGWLATHCLDASEIPDGYVVDTRHDVKIRVHADKMYRVLYLFGEYEPTESSIYCRLVGKGEVAIDVGANFGWYTVLLAKAVGEDGIVHAFEPIPEICALARDSIALNEVGDRVRLNQVGLGEATAQVTVYTFSGLPHGHASASDLGRLDARPYLCDFMCLDEYLGGQATCRISFIKADVEGYELEVFRGAQELLSTPDAPILGFEVNPDCLRSRGVSTASLAEVLRSLGYEAYWLIGGRGDISVSEGVDERGGNYIAAKRADVERVRAAVGNSDAGRKSRRRGCR